MRSLEFSNITLLLPFPLFIISVIPSILLSPCSTFSFIPPIIKRIPPLSSIPYQSPSPHLISHLSLFLSTFINYILHLCSLMFAQPFILNSSKIEKKIRIINFPSFEHKSETSLRTIHKLPSFMLTWNPIEYKSPPSSLSNPPKMWHHLWTALFLLLYLELFQEIFILLEILLCLWFWRLL